jgi:imidazolonepropionase-like amidohydrolase
MNNENSLSIFFALTEWRTFFLLIRKEISNMTDYMRNIVNNPTSTPPATLIRGATILSMDETVGNIERGDILITGSTITAVGKNLDAQGARIMDATNMIAMPGMVDSHRHA